MVELLPLSACTDPDALKLGVKLGGGEEWLRSNPAQVKELLKALGSKEGGGVSGEVRDEYIVLWLRGGEREGCWGGREVGRWPRARGRATVGVKEGGRGL